jgi:ABC-type Fe3+ transport system permease subunit
MKRHFPFVPASRQVAIYAIIALCFVAYSCYVPIERISSPQQGWALNAALLHELFGEHAAAVGSVALGLAFYGGVAFAVTLPEARTKPVPRWMYLIPLGFIGYLCYFGYVTIFGK